MALALISPNWPAPKNVQAFATTRQGGVSQFPYDSLNLGDHVGDISSSVAANRQCLPRHAEIKWLNQVHGSSCITMTTCSPLNQDADASLTSHSGVVCAVMTADCLPILLCNRQGSEVAAVHAGWKGLANGVIENTCLQLKSAPDEMIAWIGPHISQKNFEVNEALIEHFDNYTHCFTQGKKPGKLHANLQQIAIDILTTLGIEKVYTSNLCTYQQDTLFFSHRRATHQGIAQTGRMVSAIYLS